MTQPEIFGYGGERNVLTEMPADVSDNIRRSDVKAYNSAGEEKVVPRAAERSKMDQGVITSQLKKCSWNVIRLNKR